MNIKPAIKTYPAVFKTLEEAEDFQLPPNTTLYAITHKTGMHAGEIYCNTYRIKYVETHSKLGVS